MIRVGVLRRKHRRLEPAASSAKRKSNAQIDELYKGIRAHGIWKKQRLNSSGRWNTRIQLISIVTRNNESGRETYGSHRSMRHYTGTYTGATDQ